MPSSWGFPIAVVATFCAQAVIGQPVALPVGASETIVVPSEFGVYELPIGNFSSSDKPTRQVEGQIVRSAYRVPLDRNNTFAVFSTLRDELESQNYSAVFQCSDHLCGGFDFRYGIDVLPPPEMEVDLTEFHYAALQGSGETPNFLTMLVSRNSDSGFIQFVEITPDQAGTVALEKLPEIPVAESLPVSDWSTELQNLGRAVLEGINFEAGQAKLTTESVATLEKFAQFLIENAELNFLIVGHSDNTGALQANIGLSRSRAEAVRQSLISDFGIAADRLEFAGAGFLAPRALNSSEEGMALNRRVEIVLR